MRRLAAVLLVASSSAAAAPTLTRVFPGLPVAHKPGTHFVYNTPASYMLSAIVSKVSGMPLVDYLRPRLFDPLGIGAAKWDASPQGMSYGGFGLSLRTEDIARFGQLYLQRGEWSGKQVLPSSWVDAATARQVSNGSRPDSDWEQGYGYRFWRCRHGIYRGDGAFGQLCVVMPKQDAVVAITSGTPDLQGVLNLVWEHILPALHAAPLASDEAARARLAAKLGSLSLAPPRGRATSPVARRVSGRACELPKNDDGLERLPCGAVVPGGQDAVGGRPSRGHRSGRAGAHGRRERGREQPGESERARERAHGYLLRGGGPAAGRHAGPPRSVSAGRPYWARRSCSSILLRLNEPGVWLGGYSFIVWRNLAASPWMGTTTNGRSRNQSL